MKSLKRKIAESIPGVRLLLEQRDRRMFKAIASADPRANANRVYRSIFNKDINWEAPRNLIEKIYWLEMFSDTSLWTLCADKFRMRQYVESKGFGHLLPKNYGHWLNADDIDFDSLPEQFVLKTTNGCGQVLLVKDKTELNIRKTRKLLNEWMRLKYGYTDGQVHYSRIKPCIIAEEYLSCADCDSLTDYKVWCFNGKAEYVLVVYDRVILGKHQGYSLSAYDLEWNDISRRVLRKDNKHFSGRPVDRPQNLEAMIEAAQKLSTGFPQVRVDFFETDGNRLSIGELTFSTGYGYHTDEFYDYLGTKVDLGIAKRIDGINRPPLD